MKSTHVTGVLTPESFQFYRQAMQILRDANVPFLVGGAYAFACYTGIVRHTKDLDLFLRRDDVERGLAAFRMAGFHAEIAFRHWLAKAYSADDFIDLIYSSGNALCPVDDSWFEHAVEGEVLGVPSRLVPAEEMIWQKMFIMERERFDGADVNHLIWARGRDLDWQRLLQRSGSHWRVLLSHLVVFGYIYPQDHDRIPPNVLRTLLLRMQRERAEPDSPEGSMCQGTNISRIQYAIDTESRGYQDARVQPNGPLSREEAIVWTDAGR